MSEKEIYRIKDITDDWFGRFFKENRSDFVRIANSYVHDIYVAEDIVNDSFIKMWEKRKELVVDNYNAYIYKTIVNKCLDYLKSVQVRTAARQNMGNMSMMMQMYDITSLKNLNPDMLFAKEVRKIFNDCLAEMPELTRRIFVANRFYGLTYGEIAEKIGDITVRQITSQMQYALRVLRNALKDYL